MLESKGQDHLDRTQGSVGGLKFIEDELCAAVKAAVDASAYAIIVRRTGWDGERVWTLEELGNNPNASGRASPVSRERIRQLESRALATIQKKRLSMPLLDRTISVIEENAPLAAATLPSLLQRHGLTQCGLGLEAISAAMNTFKVKWNIVCRSIGQDLFLLPRDRADKIEFVWSILVEEALGRDFVILEQIESLYKRADPLLSDIVVSGVSVIPALDWLDCDHRIYWGIDRANRGWNRIINVCHKILTVAPQVPFERLATAVKRARTIRDCPPHDTLMNMLCAKDEFDIHEGIVSRGSNFSPDTLSRNDWLMIRSARDTGTATTFLELRKALVHQGLSESHAQISMVVTPLWITTSRGKYRFVASKAQLDDLSLTLPTETDEFVESHECAVELVITHRHLVTGTHRMEEGFVRRGEWSLRDELGNDLGMLDVAGSVIKGLSGALAAASIGVGATVIIDFAVEECTATLFSGTLDQRVHDQ